METNFSEGSLTADQTSTATEPQTGLTAQTESDLKSGNVSEGFLDTLTQLRKDAGLVKDTPESITKETEESVKEPEGQSKPEEKPEGEQTTEVTEKKEGEDDLKTPEGETVKATRISEVKQWGKGWQETAESRKPAQDFIESRFKGNMDEAEVSANIFDKLLGNDIASFNPVDVFNELSELSKPRAEKLIEFFATNEAVLPQAEGKVIEKLFGKDVSPEELKENLEGYKLFQQAGGLSALMGENDELPAQLLYDSEGNPRPEEEVNLFKSVLGELKSINTDRQKEADEKMKAEKAQRESQVSKVINDYTDERFEGVGKALKNLGLEEAKDDTDEVKFQKSRDSRMINFYVMGMASEDPAFKKAYTEAVDAIKNGDSFMANRKKTELNSMVAKYTSEIVDDYIKKNNIKVENFEKQIERAKEAKKEIDLGSGNPITKDVPKNESLNQRIERVMKENGMKA